MYIYNELGMKDALIYNAYDNNFTYLSNGILYTTNYTDYYKCNYDQNRPTTLDLDLLDNETISKVYSDEYNVFVITSLGRLFACGYNEQYQLCNFTTAASDELKQIDFYYNEEETLTYTTSIESGAEINVDDEIVVTFNQPIMALSLRTIKMTCNDTLIALNTTIRRNELHSKPINALSGGANCVLTIPYRSIKTALGQENNEIQITFTTKVNSVTSSNQNNAIRIDYSDEGLLELSNSFTNGGYVSNFINNSILNNYSNTDKAKWIRIFTNQGNKEINIAHNYFGTTDESIIKEVIVDQDTYSEYNNLIHNPFLESIPDARFPYLTGAQLYDEFGNETSVASAGINHIKLTFNTDMDISQKLNAYFGPDYPYTDFLIEGEWIDSRTWYGTFTVFQTTGDGLEHILVMGAKSALQYEMTKDFRFVFKISSIGAESLDLFAEGIKEGVKLNWLGNDDELAIGYNIYRSQIDSSDDGFYSLVNTEGIISLDQYEYLDTRVNSDTTYYYKIKVVYSDLSETSSESYIDVKTPDITIPNINHNPVYYVNEGSNLVLKAYCYDDNGISSVTIYYKKVSDTDYSSIKMVSYNSNNEYYGSISASEFDISGLQYYIECMDNEGNVQRYKSPTNPINVSVRKSETNTTPVITYISKISGHISGGDQIAVYGENFEVNSKVYMAGVLVETTYVNSQMLYIISPKVETAGSVSLLVENTNGETCTKNLVFTYFDKIEDDLEEQNTLKLYFLSSTYGYANGVNVIIAYGQGFNENTKVYFGNTMAESVYVSELVMYVYVPASSALGNVDVRVSDGNYTYTKYNAFEYVEAVVLNNLLVLGLSATSGSADGGNSVSIYGANFTADMDVYFGNNKVSYTLVDETLLTVTVPAGEGKVDVRVTKGSESVSLSQAYTYTKVIKDNNLQVLGLSATSGSADGGNSVSIYGANFTADMDVYFGNNKVSYTLVDETLLTVTVPAGEGKVDVRVTKGSESVSLSQAYTYVKTVENAELLIYGISSNSGSVNGGNQISIYGNNFTANTTVQIGGISVSSTLVNTNCIIASVPSHAEGYVDIALFDGDKTVTLERAYLFINIPSNDEITIIGLSTNAGMTNGGEVITIYGNNFNENLKLYFGETEATYTFINSTKLLVSVPSGLAGTVDVKLVYGEQQFTLSQSYTYVQGREYNIYLNPGIDTVYAGSSWMDAGISTDNDIIVKTDNKVNLSVAGRYEVRYYCYDKGLLVDSLVRIVNVLENPFKVSITLNDSVTTLFVGDEYIENGAQSNVGIVSVSDSNVDTSKAGVYTVTYLVTYKGISYYKTRYIHVLAANE